MDAGVLADGHADALAGVFKMLANDTRLRVLRYIQIHDEVRLTDLAAALELTPQATSNQLQRLADRRLVTSRRDGNAVYYRLLDPCIAGILDLAVCVIATDSSP